MYTIICYIVHRHIKNFTIVLRSNRVECNYFLIPGNHQSDQCRRATGNHGDVVLHAVTDQPQATYFTKNRQWFSRNA